MSCFAAAFTGFRWLSCRAMAAAHIHSPTTVPYQANIDALKRIGCTDVLAVLLPSARCAKTMHRATLFRSISTSTDLRPGKIVLLDGCTAHVGFAHPTCARLGKASAAAARASGKTVHPSATYLAMEGPQFSTLAESRLYRQWGADVIGMTGMPEAKLAREAELCYASLAMVTDYDCWHPDHDAV